MKIVLIGGGSYVFAPTVLEDVIVKRCIDGSELVLVDTDKEAAAIMEDFGHKIAADTGVNVMIWSTDNRAEALPGADFVIVSAAVQGFKRWLMDYSVLKELDIGEQARECGGLGGLIYAFRSITLLLNICMDMEKFCPNAVLLDVTNPMPRVITAVNKYTSIEAIGFCNAAWHGATGYEWFARLAERETDGIEVITTGLNHFAWLLEIKDKKTGENLFPAVKSKILNGDGREFNVMRRWYKKYGGIIAGFIDHHAEFLPFDPEISYRCSPPFHGDENERRQRTQNLREAAAGRIDWHIILKKGSWEHPVDAAEAIYKKIDRSFDVVNILNKGYIPQLPDGRVVEVPAAAHNGRLAGITVPPLPDGVAEICNSISNVHELAAEAAVKGDIRLAERAVEIDPAITDKKTAMIALAKLLKIHSDILPQFDL